MSDSDNWRDSSNWRRDAGPSTARNSRPGQGRSVASSWRTGVNSRDTESQPRQEQRGGEWAPRSRPFDREKGNNRPQRDDEGAAKAIAEGRRIYIGNLRYQAKPDDIEDLLNTNELGAFVSIHISIDPFTGRNPSYCFVEFSDRESADRAMSTLEGKLLLGREVKCRPCIPKGGPSGGKQDDAPNRWGNWSGERNARDRGDGDGPTSDRPPRGDDSSASFTRYAQDFTGQRLYVGGLPRMHDQAANSSEIGELFKDFQVEAISKRITAHESTRNKPGRHDFCFVDFATSEQAKAAMEAVNGQEFRGGRLKVSFASGRSNKWRERENLDVADTNESARQI
ncbi:RNA-binding domain-containing protein, partial [Hypomontagnella monticulosa]